MAKDYTIRFTG
jgi:hypothetical protein